MKVAAVILDSEEAQFDVGQNQENQVGLDVVAYLYRHTDEKTMLVLSANNEQFRITINVEYLKELLESEALCTTCDPE